jgi:hypothetical protein
MFTLMSRSVDFKALWPSSSYSSFMLAARRARKVVEDCKQDDFMHGDLEADSDVFQRLSR